MQPETTLTKDIFSNFKQGKDLKQYGKKGEKVKLLKVSGDMVLVEGKEKFWMKKCDTST